MVDRMVCCKSLIKLLSSAMRKPFSFETLVFVLLFLEGLRSCLCMNSSFGRCIEGERLALLTLKQSLEDPSNRLLSWSGEDCCHWRGVSCSTSTGRVILLDLRVPSYASYYYKTEWRPIISYNTSEKLSAVEVHPSLGELKQLEYLDLSGNDFKHSPIPQFLGSLKSLRYLNLSSAGFSGNIPHQLGNLTSLRVLDLSYDYYVIYTVDEPLYTSSLQWASSLSSLEYLDLSLANLSTAFDLIHVLSQLPSLQQLRLQHCGIQNVHFQPRDSVDFTFLASVRFLYLEGNELSGQIPAAFHNLTALRGLALGNQVGDLVYADSLGWLSRLSSLQHLDMSFVDLRNALDLMQVLNTLPALRHLRLQRCYLGNTHFTHGSANSSLFLSRIQFLDLARNGFVGPIPNALKNMTAIKSLNLNANGFNSSLPALGSKSLVYLNVRWNEFDSIEGGVVSILNRACSLYSLGLSNEYYRSDILIGKLNSSSCPTHDLEFLILELYPVSTNMPDWLGQLNRLKYLHLRSSSLTGSIPLSITELSNLRILDLSSNQLNGTIPDSLGSLSALEELDISSNKLSGTIPQSSGRLSALRKLDLSSNQYLRGTIPQSLGSLFALEHLDLSNNELSGIIPLSFGKSPSLSFLGLSNNQLEGMVPQTLVRLSNLQVLDLSQNQLVGAIPEQLSRLSALETLDLSQNQLVGAIPEQLSRLSALRGLNLSHNHLSGSIPESIGKLGNLYTLDISYNTLEGNVSELHFANMSWLGKLIISSNRLTCKMKSDWIPPFNSLSVLKMSSCVIGSQFPRWIQVQNGLSELELSNANISGPFPIEFYSYNLIHLDLSKNQISGRLPVNIEDGMGSIAALLLGNNQLNGSISDTFCNLEGLQVLDLSENELSGGIPDCWRSSAMLSVINLSFNRLSGTIPNSIRNLALLRWLHLNGNNLEGELPLALTYCLSLQLLDVGENNISGVVPAWIGENLLSLRILRLRDNSLMGNIPSQLCQLSELQILDLALNSLSGRIPRCFGNLNGMRAVVADVGRDNLVPISTAAPPAESPWGPPVEDSTQWPKEKVSVFMKGKSLDYTTTLLLVDGMDLSRNKLNGSIPDELCTLSGLRVLNLSHNHLVGKIPNKIGNLKVIETLDLSDNKLFGSIPQTMSTIITLNHLNLSYNNLSGEIPTGSQLQTLGDPSIYAGNVQLCGYPLPKCTGDHEQADSPTSSAHKEKDDKKEKILFWFVVTSGYATGLWAVVGVLVVKKNWRIAYFRFADDAKEWIIVMAAVTAARLKHSIQRISSED